MIDKVAEIALLLDAYGELLTNNRKDALRLRYEEDLSLAEIAKLYNVTRQGAQDLITRGEAQLQEFESKLHYVERASAIKAGLQAALAQLGDNDTESARNTIAALLAEEEG